jgi:O-antigen ligase
LNFLLSISARFERASKYAAVITAFGITLGTSFTATGFAITGLFWLLSGHWREKYIVARSSPVVVAAVLLFCLYLVGLGYTSAPLGHGLVRVGAYVNSLFFVAVFATIVTDPLWRDRVFVAFMAGMGLSLLLSLLSVMGIFPWIAGHGSGSAHTFYSYITHNFFMAIAIYSGFTYWLFRAGAWPKWARIAVPGILILGVIDLLFLVDGRTGHVVFLAMVMTYLIARYRWKGIGYGLAAISVITATAIALPGSFNKRTVTAVKELESSVTRGDNETSIGLRYRFYKYGIQIIHDKPLMGHGTGSIDDVYMNYDPAYAQLYPDKGAHLHSEFLMVASELGFFGLAIFITLLGLMARLASQLAGEHRYLALGVLTAYAVGSMVNSMLLDANEGHLFALLTGALYSGVGLRGRSDEDSSIAQH